MSDPTPFPASEAPDPVEDDAAPAEPAPAAKTTPAKKTAAKKAPAKRTPAKKAPAEKTTAKKTTAKKTTAKKAPAKKTTAKKTPARKTAATSTTVAAAGSVSEPLADESTTAATKAPARKAAAKKSPAKKTAAKKAPATKATAKKAPAKKAATSASGGAAGAVALEKSSDESAGSSTDKAEAKPPGRTRARAAGPPFWVFAALTLLIVVGLVVGAIAYFAGRGDSTDTDSGDQAAAAAGRALPAVLSYDYRRLGTDRDQASRFLTPAFRKDYLNTFDTKIMGTKAEPGAAVQVKGVAKARVQDTGVVEAQKDRVQLIVFVNQSTTKAGGSPQLSLNRLTVSMKKSGNQWLVDNITSY